MRRTRNTTVTAALVAVFAMLMANFAFADEINLSAASTTVAPGGNGSFVVYLVANDDSTDLIDGCNAQDSNQTDVGVKFTSSNESVVATPANVNLVGCDNPATAAIENGVTVNYSVPLTATPGATTTITPAVLNNEQGIRVELSRNNNVSGSFSSPDSFVVTVQAANPCAGRAAPAQPTVALAGSPAGTGWFNTASAAGAEAFSISPITNAEYSLDGGTTWTGYSSAVTLADGQHSVIARNFLPATADCVRLNGTPSNATSIDIDRSAPNAPTVSVSPAANAAGWNNTNVSVDFTNGTDNGPSGIASCTADTTLTANTTAAGETRTGTCTDNAGNVSSQTETRLIKIDKDAPNAPIASALPAANGAGWNNTDVAVAFTANGDNGPSGVNSCTAGETLSSNTTTDGVSRTGTCTDVAGNTSTSATTRTIKIDKDAPVVRVTDGTSALTSPASFQLGSVPSFGCSTTDILSGVATSATVGAYSTGIGADQTVQCTGAADNAGNGGSASLTYSVTYGRDGGIRQPINADATSIFKRGQSIPVKFGLLGDGGSDYPNGFTTTGWSLARQATSCATGVDEGVTENIASTSSSTTFRYDALADQYIYNANTKDVAAGCYKYIVRLDDGTTLASATFRVVTK